MSGNIDAVKDASPGYAVEAAKPSIPAVYKKSEVGLIPEDWKTLCLSDVAKRITRGASPRPIDNPIWFDPKSSVGWVRISDVTRSGRYLYETTQQLSEAGIKNSRPVPKGSLIMSICATVGRPIETKMDVCIHDGFVVFEQPEIDQSFLYHTLVCLEPTWSKHGQTGSQMNLNTGLINGCVIAIPPSDAEQRAIATTLSDVDALLEELDRLIAKKRDLKQATMQQLLTGQTRLPGFKGEWEVKRLGDGCSVITKGTTPTSVGKEFIASGITFLKVETLSDNGRLITNQFAYIDSETHRLLKRSQLHEGDLLISIAGALGRSAIVPKCVLPANTNQALAIVRLLNDSIFDPNFVYHVTNSWRVKKYFSSISAQGAQANLSLQQINDIPIYHPGMREQIAIATVLSDMDAEIEEVEQRRAKTAALKQSMMQELLTGRTRLI